MQENGLKAYHAQKTVEIPLAKFYLDVSVTGEKLRKCCGCIWLLKLGDF